MILPKEKSPIQRKKTFALRGDLLTRNTFYPIGKSRPGRYHVVILSDTTLDWNSLYLHDTDIEHSSECSQFFICGIENSIIGSLFEVSVNKLDVTPNRLAIVRHQDLGTFESPVNHSVGGTVTYNDNSGNIVVIPTNVHPNSFLVSV